MPDSKKYLHPETLGRISKLELRARHVVEGFLSGTHRSPYFGQSIEFLQHREYAVGDDLRHIDWKVLGKHDRYVIKQYEEYTNLRCMLMVDASASMSYGDGPMTKYDYACTIAASLAYLILKQQDAVGCAVFDDSMRYRVPVLSKRTHLNTIVEALANQSPREKTDMQTICKQFAETYTSRGLVIVISDLFGDVEATSKGLRILRQRGHDVMVFHVMDDDELDFPFTGSTRFEGLELPDHLTCNPRALREGYLAAVNEFTASMRRECSKNTIDYALVRTRDSLAAVLTTYLSNRLGMHHRN
ncbi:DUF58 domain-containing protein [Bremerella cremea]|uniref:DUF58 domain-containing protein n=1 Tax=Bremerella cremea TaxID=1031537 RepID=UPI0031E7005D